MKIMLMAVAAAGLLAGAASAQDHAANRPHKVFAPSDIRWGPGPASLPPGARAAVLYGDPTKDGIFAMRLKFPAGYRIAPHTHPKPEIVTVISGAFHMGMGTTADRARAHRLTAGMLSTMEPGTPHYGFTDRETVLQINGTGPWAVAYVNSADDLRGKR